MIRHRLDTAFGRRLKEILGTYGIAAKDLRQFGGPDPVSLSRFSKMRTAVPVTAERREQLARRIAQAICRAVEKAWEGKVIPIPSPKNIQTQLLNALEADAFEAFTPPDIQKVLKERSAAPNGKE